MKNNYLLDTNIIIDYLRNYSPIANFVVQELLQPNNNLAISGITELELYAGQSMKKPEHEMVVKEFLGKFEIISVSKRILIKSGILIRTYQIEPHDAIIASTVLSYNLQLVTRNIKHFQSIKDLKIISP